MKYMQMVEDDLSDGYQAGAMRDEATGKMNWDQVGSTAGKGAAGGAAGLLLGGPVGAVVGAGMAVAKDLKRAKHAKLYNEGYEEAQIGAMDDLTDADFTQGPI